MTSTASQQTPNPAPPTSAPSYASAAGANKKPSSTPLIAPGSNPPPVVVGSSSSTPQNGKPAAPSPVNGRPAITPAVPSVSPIPSVAHSSHNNVNGTAVDHSRTTSVTISANGPSYPQNGGPVGGPKANIKFGYQESPGVAHSTPMQQASAPIPIPGNPRVASPANSPSPIPQPSASGGRPPSGMQGGPQPTFGSFSGDGDRQLRQPSLPQNPVINPQQAPAHLRKDSVHSIQSDMGNHGPPAQNRGGFQGQGGRGRGYNGQNMGYPPNRQYPGPAAQGRGGMQPYQGRGGMPGYHNSPQPHRSSPAIAPAMPHQGTPQMQAAMPMQNPNAPYYPSYPTQNYGGYMPATQYDQMGRPMGMPYAHYPHVGMMNNGPAQSPSPAYAQGYQPGQFGPSPAGPQPMSRNSSQISDRPASSMGQAQPPVIVQGNPQGQAKAPVVSSSTFVQPKKTTIVIKNSQGQTVDLASIKAQSAPSPSPAPSKTPPVIASTPTPPPKPTTPANVRTESTAPGKTAEQLRNEFKEQVRKQAESPADPKAKDAPADADVPEEKAAAEEKTEESEPPKVVKPQPVEPKADEVSVKPAADVVAKPAAEPSVKEPEPVAPADKEAGAASDKMSDEELDRIIREMEEEDARREKEQAEHTARKAAEKEAAKKAEEANKAANAAENDRKLREQEREMERIEEEREKRRQENEAKESAQGKTRSVADMLADKISDLTISDRKDGSSPAGAAEKAGDSALPTPTGDGSSKAGASEKPKAKPAALNLAPLNTKPVEPPQPSAALQSLKSARFLSVKEQLSSETYPSGLLSPNPALNSAVARKGKAFKYDAQFLLQFQKVFTEQPSVEFHQQVKTLIGESDGSRSATAGRASAGAARQGSSRGGSGFTMGAFNAPPPGKTLPPGTTSAERFAMSQGTMARPGITPMASFGRPGGAFPGGSQMARTPSSSNMGGVPQSPRIKSGRNSSKRDFSAKNEEKLARTMPLTAGMDLKPITTSSTGWKPSSLGNKPSALGPGAGTGPSGLLDPEMVQRKVKAALNKMTPEKFDKIADQILEIAGQSKDETDGRTLRQVIQLTFEKATDEAHWASMYAKFCKRMLETMSPEIRDANIVDKQGNVVSGGALFRKYLLNRCQEEFERGWKVDLPKPEEGEDPKSQEAALMSDEYYIAAAAKRRGLGLVQFIGELYKLGMLTERIMHECVRKLLEFQGVPDEAEIESLCKLLRTIGGNLDSTEKGKPMMDVYFQRINHVIELPELPSRLKFMLMDVVDLRRAQWESKEANKGPKTLEEVRIEAEVAAQQKAAENARSSQRGGPGGRPAMGRGDARSFSTYTQAAPNQVGMDDLRRLKGTATSRVASQNVTLGPTSMFSSRSNSGRRGGPGGVLGRPGEDSQASSRTGTPPTTVAHTNAFGLLADTGDHPTSPPSTVASPSLSKVAPDTPATGGQEKKDD